MAHEDGLTKQKFPHGFHKEAWTMESSLAGGLLYHSGRHSPVALRTKEAPKMRWFAFDKVERLLLEEGSLNTMK